MIEHKTVSLAEQVFEHLENNILSGVYSRGEYLTELKLVADLGVSRTPIREALHRLETEHIIETTSKGILVLGVTEKDIEDIYEIRLKIEGLAARKAAENITDDQLKEMKETVELQEFYVEKKDAEQIRKMDSKFHYQLYLYSGSNVYLDTLEPHHKKLQKYRKASVENSERAKLSVLEHKAIYDAIASRDGKAAEEAAFYHVGQAKNHILKK